MAAYRKRRRGSRQSGRLVLFLMLICAVGLAVYLKGNVFIVREVKVSGVSAEEQNRIMRLSGIELGDNIFRVDAEQVRKNLAGDGHLQLTGVDCQLPGTVVISVETRRPAALINYLGVVLVVDGQGYILEQRGDMADLNVPVVSGVKISQFQVGKLIESSVPGQIAAMDAVLSELETQNATEQISELNVANLDNLYLVSRAGLQIQLGDSSNLSDKLIWMRGVMSQLESEGLTTGVLDVSSGKSAVYGK